MRRIIELITAKRAPDDKGDASDHVDDHQRS